MKIDKSNTTALRYQKRSGEGFKAMNRHANG